MRAPRPFRPSPPLPSWRRPPETPAARLRRLATDAAFITVGTAMTAVALAPLARTVLGL